MSEKEKAIEIINRLPESKIGYIVTFLKGFEMNEDIEDDLYCENLYQEYLADNSEDKHDTISLEDYAEQLGVSL